VAVTVDAVATAPVHAATNVVTLTSNNQTVGAGSTLLLVFLSISGWNAGASAFAGHWDTAGTNQTLTVVRSSVDANTNCYSVILAVVSPTAGNKTLTCTWTGANLAQMDSISLFGTVATSVATACVNAAGTNGITGAPSLPLTGTAGGANMSVAMVGVNTVGITSLLTTGSTSIFIDNTNSAQIGCEAARAPSAASITWAGLPNPNDSWSMVGCDVVADQVPPTPPDPLEGGGGRHAMIRQIIVIGY